MFLQRKVLSGAVKRWPDVCFRSFLAKPFPHAAGLVEVEGYPLRG